MSKLIQFHQQNIQDPEFSSACPRIDQGIII